MESAPSLSPAPALAPAPDIQSAQPQPQPQPEPQPEPQSEPGPYSHSHSPAETQPPGNLPSYQDDISRVSSDVVNRDEPPAATQAPAPAPAPAPTPAPVPTSEPVASSVPSTIQQPQSQRQHTPSTPRTQVVVPRNTKYNIAQRFPSPRQDYEPAIFDQDLKLLTHAVQQAMPQAVRRVIRDNWEKSLLGSEFHHAFLLNAVVHHANGVIVRRSIKDFGTRMISESKNEIISHFKSHDLDEVTDTILARCSDAFLDKAMEKRLKTIDARSLINALARAERLGYENGDVLEDHTEKSVTTKPKSTSSTPSFNHVQQAAPKPLPQAPTLQTQQTQPPARHAPSTTAAAAPSLQCRLCWRKFDRTAPYEYHVQKQLCTKEPPNPQGFPFLCEHCGAGFITKVGQQYHLANRVCGEHGTAPATPPQPGSSASPITLSSRHNSPAQPLPVPSYYPSSQQRPTASQPKATQATTPFAAEDPYGHLSPQTREQLMEELRLAELSFVPRFREAEDIADPVERKIKLDGIQNSFSTKQSLIRKKYGVRLRNRRTRAEIDGERARLGLKHAYSNGSESHETPAPKRQRAENGVAYTQSQATPSSNHSVPPSNHLAVSDMNSGLGGSAATAAMTDPTQFLSSHDTPTRPPQNSLSSYQRKGYRVSSHVSQPSPTTGSANPFQRNGSASAPVVLDDDDSSDTENTDSGGDIPAKLPSRKGLAT
ncbi:hypothetical protein F5X99DRAFT_26612 [Biscogniauxia marginata]|nr:hypothetical protein F5X99DRAFT_26612 [Biscogniauxia marginata]